MKKVVVYIFTYLFPILMLDYYLILRGLNLNSIIILPVFFVLTVEAIKIGIKKGRSSFFILSANIFILYSLLTVICYLFNDAPLSCFFDTFRSFVFPLIFAYLGYQFSIGRDFDKWYVFGCTFCFLVGFYLYLEAPSYYVAFMAEVRANAFNASSVIDESNVMDFARFSSFFTTSYAVSCLSIPALVMSLAFSSRCSGRKKVLFVVCAISSFIAAILSQQRIAMGFAIVVVVFWLFYSRKIDRKRKKFTIVLVFLVLFVFIYFGFRMITNLEWYDRVFDLVSGQFGRMSFTEAMSGRMEQYTTFDRLTDLSLIFGLGLGSCGHAAEAAGLKSITDGEFLKLFYEFGLVGCFFLAMVIVPSLYRGLKYFKYYYAEVIIVIFYLAAGIGSDSLTFFIFSIMFWYSLGRIWNKDYFEILKQERLQQRYGS